MIPNMPKYDRIIEILIKDDGAVVLISKSQDGTSSTRELRERPGGIYELVGSRSGDKYRIIPADGNLQLLDNDGLIRVARRVEGNG